MDTEGRKARQAGTEGVLPSAGRRFDIEGKTLGYPTRFRDGSSLAGIFVVKSDVANSLIEASGFRVAEVAPGRALLVLTGVHYTDTDCGEYEETAFAFFVEQLGRASSPRYLGPWLDLARGDITSFTWKLQVTTRLSQQAGIQMWGFPKTLDEIDFQQQNGEARCRLRMDGRDVFEYAMPARGRQTPSPITSRVYSIHEGAPHASFLTQGYRDVGNRPGGGRLRLGDHPLADELRRLGLPRRPLLATWSGHLDFSMSAPEKL